MSITKKEKSSAMALKQNIWEPRWEKDAAKRDAMFKALVLLICVVYSQ
jgi:hypothetical protein